MTGFDQKMIDALREYASDCGWGDECCVGCSMSDLCEEGFGPANIADKLESIIKERDEAQARLCEWCGVCPADKRDLSGCEIADVYAEKKQPGKWKERYLPEEGLFMRRRFYCSACGDWNGYGKTEFCPHCGTKMEVEP